MRTRTVLVDPAPPEKPAYDRPSKSQLKRDMTALQELGRDLGELSRDRLKELDLPEKLHEALLAYQSITAHEGKRRQFQFIGRLMRDVDPVPLREALERFNGASKVEIQDMHLAERWRERLLGDEPTALAEFAAAYPATNFQELRVMMRNARKERETGKPPRDFRKLYQLIREQMGGRSARQPDAAPPEGAPDEDAEE